MSDYDSINAYPTPKVGDGATICYWTDRRPATVIAVSKTGAKVTVQEDRAERIDDRSNPHSVPDYRYEPDPKGRTESFYRAKDGGYGPTNGTRLAIGYRRYYYDMEF